MSKQAKPQVREGTAVWIEPWFSSLNAVMQRRVLHLARRADLVTLAQVLEWFPLPVRQGHRWEFPIKGEVDRLDRARLLELARELRTDLRMAHEELRLKRLVTRAKPVWTDVTLRAHERGVCAQLRGRGRLGDCGDECPRCGADLDVAADEQNVEAGALAELDEAWREAMREQDAAEGARDGG